MEILHPLDRAVQYLNDVIDELALTSYPSEEVFEILCKAKNIIEQCYLDFRNQENGPTCKEIDFHSSDADILDREDIQ